MEVIDDGIDMDVIPQLEKAYSPISVIELGIEKDVSDLQFTKVQ